MKKLLSLVAALILLPLQAHSQEMWQEGTHYQVLNHKATEKKEVKEFFSFWCPHCFRFEPFVTQIEQKLGKDVTFEKVHVNFMGFTTKEIQEEATAAMMVARALGKEHELNEAIFNYIHLQRNKIEGLKDFRNIFFMKDVSGEEFDKLVKSFNVKNRVMQNNKVINDYRGDVNSVPTFIVNGKYKAQMVQGMKPDDFVNLIVWLTQLND